MRPMNLQDDVMTVDKLLLAQAKMNICGMRVVVSPLVGPVPKIQIRPDFKWCSDEFRARFNKWLLDEFGTKEVAYMVSGGTVVVSPHMANVLRIDR